MLNLFFFFKDASSTSDVLLVPTTIPLKCSACLPWLLPHQSQSLAVECEYTGKQGHQIRLARTQQWKTNEH